jgi:hypothetical protein
MKPDFPSIAAFTTAAELLKCDRAAIQAVGRVECGPEGAFFDSGEPAILFEAHRFHALTKGKFAGARAAGIAGEPGVLSRSKWMPGTYGPNSIQHARLAAAAALDRDAALMATSWGLFQVLGEHWKRCGYGSVQSFVNAAYQSADDHLQMFVHFILADAKLVTALRAKAWATFAAIYNGPGYKANKYDKKLAAAYSVFSAGAT